MFKRKRVQAAVIAFCMVMTLAPGPVFSQGTGGNCGINGDNVKWSYEDGHLSITGSGYMRAYTEASKAPWYNKYSDYIVSVSIESGITNIGDYSFFWCDKLESVTIPDSVTNIGNYAFSECGNLASVTIPNSVTSIGDSAFQNCDRLTGVTIPSNVISIGESAFSSCDNLTSVTIQNGTKSIGTFAFSGCGNLESITLPNSVVSIGDNAFDATACYNEWWYNSAKYNVLYIGNHLIKADSQVLNDGIPKGSISDQYAIKPGTKTIADYAFIGCDELKSITIPDSVVSIGNYAFESCSGLTGMAIPENVIRIGNCAFQTCIGLTNISVADGNSAYCSENGILYNKEKTEIICFPKNKSDNSFEIPDGITAIVDGAFERCWNLTNVTIPNGVKTIGDDAFNYCRALTSITIPDGVTSIGNYTFFNCSSLTSVTIPNSVTSIGEYAFNKCNKLKNVNYIGSKEDWGTIDKGEDHSISDSIITYCKGIKAVQLNSGKIAVEPINTEIGKTVILALYNGDKFVDMQFGIYDGEEIQFKTDKIYTRAKAMVWESLESMIPVCGAKTAE